MEEKKTFEYKYSAKQQEEIDAIKQKYLPKQEQPEDKMETLRRLDRQAERPGMIAALTLGVIGILIFGSGMSLAMVLPAGVPVILCYVMGILLGIFGIFLMALAYPAYKKITKAQREKIAPQILKLTEELGGKQ
ncbi:MAG: hypothetical protein E7260_03570 [Lachnospiraceae bacterium]|nr:hypothetical protein [Lachnospiraceae bacterium]